MDQTEPAAARPRLLVKTDAGDRPDLNARAVYQKYARQIVQISSSLARLLHVPALFIRQAQSKWGWQWREGAGVRPPPPPCAPPLSEPHPPRRPSRVQSPLLAASPSRYKNQTSNIRVRSQGVALGMRSPPSHDFCRPKREGHPSGPGAASRLLPLPAARPRPNQAGSPAPAPGVAADARDGGRDGPGLRRRRRVAQRKGGERRPREEGGRGLPAAARRHTPSGQRTSGGMRRQGGGRAPRRAGVVGGGGGAAGLRAPRRPRGRQEAWA
jgi:hypothetical protein